MSVCKYIHTRMGEYVGVRVCLNVYALDYKYISM